MPDFTARITEELRALPSPIGAEPFTENDDGAPMWLSCLPWELLLCKIAKIVAAAAEEYYRPRVETVEQLDALLAEWAMSEDGSIFAPRSLQDIRDRHARSNQLVCNCLDSDHENALHDLAINDVPVLLRLIEHLVLWSPGAGSRKQVQS